MFVVALGNAFSGTVIVGPFDDRAAAESYCREIAAEHGNGYAIVPIVSPSC